MDSPRSPLEKTRRSHYLAGMGAALVWLKARPKEARCACAPGVAVQGCHNITESEGHFDLWHHGHCTITCFFSTCLLGRAFWLGPVEFSYSWPEGLVIVLHNGHLFTLLSTSLLPHFILFIPLCVTFCIFALYMVCCTV